MPEFNPKNNRSELLKYAVNILSRRPYFFVQLKNKLQERAKKLELTNFEDDLSSILTELQKSGYLNDSYLAEAYVRRCLGRLQGPKVIRYKLQQLGLNSSQIAEALATEESQKALAEAKSKITGRLAGSEEFKVASKLYQRGF